MSTDIDSSSSRLSSWKESFLIAFQPGPLSMLFLGISAGIPLLLIFSSLFLWLGEAGVDKSTITFFAWAALPYSFKFIWAPVISVVPLPFLTRQMGIRRSWLLVSQLFIMVFIVSMSSIDPAGGEHFLVLMAMAAVGVGFSSATQDIVIDAYRIESAGKDLQAMMSSMYVIGYRIGMLISGAGAIFLAEKLGTDVSHYQYSAWQLTYMAVAASLLIGVITTLIIKEPEHTQRMNSQLHYTKAVYIGFLAFFFTAVAAFISSYRLTSGMTEMLTGTLTAFFHNGILASVVAGFLRLCIGGLFAVIVYQLFLRLNLIHRPLVRTSYIEPVTDFFTRYSTKQVVLIFALIALYRLSDIVLGVVANPFYQDMGFSKSEIATVVKLFGLLMTLLGGFLGGILAAHFGVLKTLFLGGVVTVLTNLLFMQMAQAGHDITWFTLVISADNLAGGLAVAAFIAYLSSLVNLSFTASQYAIFSSIMTLFPKIFSGYSGTLVDMMGYPSFFLLSSVLGLPVLLVIWLVRSET